MTLKDSEVRSYRAEVLRRVNEIRKKHNLRSVRLSNRLSMCAKYHARDVMKMGHSGHVGSDGSSMQDRLERINYKYAYACENAASGQEDAEHVVRSWMKSKGHRDNILNTVVCKMGLYVVQNKKGRKFWIQLFALERSDRKSDRKGKCRCKNCAAKRLLNDIRKWWMFI